jgi:hypothetical protein
MPFCWNARQILEIDLLSYKCAGTIKNGESCGVKEDSRQASILLDRLSRKNIVATGLDEDTSEILSDIAALVLCNRWHRHKEHSQIHILTVEWRDLVDNFITESRQAVGEVEEPLIYESQLPVGLSSIGEGSRPSSGMSASITLGPQQPERISVSLPDGPRQVKSTSPSQLTHTNKYTDTCLTNSSTDYFIVL